MPKAEIPEISDDRIAKALESLTEIQYFSDCPHKHRAWAWDALNTLAPDLARLSSEDPSAAYERIHGTED